MTITFEQNNCYFQFNHITLPYFVKYLNYFKSQISILMFSKVIYSFYGEAEFSSSLFSVTLFFKNHSNMLIWCSKNILIYIFYMYFNIVKNVF